MSLCEFLASSVSSEILLGSCRPGVPCSRNPADALCGSVIRSSLRFGEFTSERKEPARVETLLLRYASRVRYACPRVFFYYHHYYYYYCYYCYYYYYCCCCYYYYYYYYYLLLLPTTTTTTTAATTTTTTYYSRCSGAVSRPLRRCALSRDGGSPLSAL